MSRAAALANARDVAELTGVREGVLYRSDAPWPGDAAPDFAPWPPACVVDLRSDGEVNGAAHPLAGDGTVVLHRSMLSVADPVKMVEAAERGELTLDTVYAELLRGAGPVLVEVARLVASADGPVLLHCTAGKDRTGVAVAVLLGAVGVPDEAIVADFVATESNVDAIVARMAASWPEEERAHRLELMGAHSDLMRSPATAIGGVLEQLAATPGGAAGWLRERGLADDDLHRLRERLAG